MLCKTTGLDGEFTPARKESPEAALMRACLEQAIRDASMRVRRPKKNEDQAEYDDCGKYGERIRKEARDWLMADNRRSGYRYICQKASIDPDELRQALWKTYPWARQYKCPFTLSDEMHFRR